MTGTLGSGYIDVQRGWEVPVMPERGDHGAARLAGRDRLRASHADREQVIDLLKDAFVQDRLTKDEFDSRVGQAFAAHTQADLDPLTADLPAGPPAVAARQPWRPENTTARNSARVVAVSTVLTAGAWAGFLLGGSDGQLAGGVALCLTFIWLGIVCLFGSVLLESRLDKRRRGQPRSGRGNARLSGAG
jgi:hypothetical protein